MPPRVRFADQMQAVLDGRSAFDDLSDDLKYSIQIEFYRLAAKILDLPTKDLRREELSKLPESIKPHVERWALKLHSERRRAKIKRVLENRNMCH